MRFVFSLILLFVCVNVSSAQQAAVDSLRNVLNAADSDTARVTATAYIAFHTALINPDSALIIAQEALDFAERIKFERGVASANNSFGWIYFNTGKLDKSVDYYNKALEYFRRSNNEISQMAVLLNMSTVYIKMGSYANAMEVLTEALPFADKHPATSEASVIYKNIGIIYRNDGKLDEAVKYLDKAYQINVELGNKTLAADTRVSMSIMFQNMGDYDRASSALDDAEKLYASKNSDYGLTMVAENRGGMYFKQGRYLEALNYFGSAKDGFEKLGYDADVAYISLEISKTYERLGRLSESLGVLNEAFPLVDSSGFKNYIYEMLDQKAKIYEQMGNSAEALRHQRLAFDAYVEYQNELETNRLNEIKVQFETEQKDAEISLLNKDNELQIQRIQRQRLLLLFILSTILLILTLIGVFIYRYRLKMKTKELDIRSRIAADLHDDVGSSVSSIRMLSEIALHNAKHDPAQLQVLLGKINDNAKDIVENTSDIVWMIKPGYDEIDSVIDRMERYIHDLCNSRDIAYTINLEALRNIKLDMTQRKNLYLIFKEAVNNAVKYSGTKSLNAIIKIDGRQIQMEIQDYGVGFDSDNTVPGNGIGNMMARAKELGGLLKIQSKPGLGTNISTILPI
jgi:two-component system, NarL family, sensor histidine kinase UhpB